MTYNSTTRDCYAFNASMFAVGDRDVEQVDFSGSYCDVNHDRADKYEGTYQIVRSSDGRTGSGKVSGVADERSFVLHFIKQK